MALPAARQQLSRFHFSPSANLNVGGTFHQNADEYEQLKTEQGLFWII